MEKEKDKKDLLKFESQFSIYKVDYDQSCEYFINKRQIIINSYDELANEIIEDIKYKISNKPKNRIEEISNLGFRGLLFKTHHTPTWDSVVNALRGNKDMINDSTIIKEVENIHISYVLLYKKGKNIFLLTAGLGSSYITEFTQKNYGLYLVPKLLKENSSAIRTVLENNLLGNRVSTMHANRNTTNISTEKDMSTIFRELALELNNEVIEILGMTPGENKRDSIITVNARDSFVIRKSMPIEKIRNVLDKLIKIEERRDNFSMGYLINAKKYKYPISDLNKMLVNKIVNKDIEGILLTYDEYYKYYTRGERYILKDLNNEIVLNQTTPIRFNDIYDIIPSLTKTKVEEILKYEMEVYGREMSDIGPIQLKNCIQAIVDDKNGNSFFLYSGNWLMFDKSYMENLKNDFKKIYNEIIIQSGPLLTKISNREHKKTEDDYNLSFKESDEVILAHKVTIDEIELADLIYIDQDDMYLIHNKSTFNGNGARDVFNQILVSAEYIQNKPKSNTLGAYYNKIKEKYPNNKKIQELDEQDFVNLFNKRNIHYVAGFMNNLSDNTKSNSAKYMVITSYDKMVEKNYKLNLFDIGE